MEILYKTEKSKKEYASSTGEVALKSSITLPVFRSGGFSDRANAFYAGLSERFERFCGKKLLNRASKRGAGKDAPPFGAVMQSKVTFANEEYVSAITDVYIYDGVRRGDTVRVSQVWNVSDGVIENIDTFVPPSARGAAFEEIVSQAVRRERDGERDHGGSAAKLVKKYFDEKRFYLVPGGIAFYFAAGELDDTAFPEVFIIKNAKIAP